MVPAGNLVCSLILIRTHTYICEDTYAWDRSPSLNTTVYFYYGTKALRFHVLPCWPLALHSGLLRIATSYESNQSCEATTSVAHDGQLMPAASQTDVPRRCREVTAPSCPWLPIGCVDGVHLNPIFGLSLFDTFFFSDLFICQPSPDIDNLDFRTRTGGTYAALYFPTKFTADFLAEMRPHLRLLGNPGSHRRPVCAQPRVWCVSSPLATGRFPCCSVVLTCAWSYAAFGHMRSRLGLLSNRAVC